MSGWIKLYRQLTNWEWYTDVPVKTLFIHCILKANHEPQKWRGVNIDRGQFISSYENLSKETGLSIRQIRTALNKLKTTQEMTYQTTSRYTVISIKNYDLFQAIDTTNDNQMTNERQSNDKQTTTNKNIEKEKNIKKERNIDIVCDIDFEKTFSLYKKTCTNLIPLNYERRNRKTLESLRNFLDEIDYDFEYFETLCKKANDLEKIVDTKIDFKSLINNHIGIMNDKYKKSEVKKGVSENFIKDYFANIRAEKGLNSE